MLLMVCNGRFQISTHALREEGDNSRSLATTFHHKFLPTPSARRATRSGVGYWYSPSLFLPTPSARRATFVAACTRPYSGFLPTPSARRATPWIALWVSQQQISTHALREEGDGRIHGKNLLHFISTHALREEGDNGNHCIMGRRMDFYPRPPRGGRPLTACLLLRSRAISTHALREEGDWA